MADYRGGPLDSLTKIFLEVLHKATENNTSIDANKYIEKWNNEIKDLNKILTTVR